MKAYFNSQYIVPTKSNVTEMAVANIIEIMTENLGQQAPLELSDNDT